MKTKLYLPENPQGFRYSVEHTLHPCGEGAEFGRCFARDFDPAIKLFCRMVETMNIGCVALYDHQEQRKVGEIYF